jgi:hypothetical protein
MIKDARVVMGKTASVLSGAAADAEEDGEPYAAADLVKTAAQPPVSVSRIFPADEDNSSQPES